MEVDMVGVVVDLCVTFFRIFLNGLNFFFFSVQFQSLNEENIILEEETWLNLTSLSMQIKSRNVTWEQYAYMREESTFTPHAENPNWYDYNFFIPSHPNSI
jgi:hypothetical protein